ncbi:MAG: hypothetical protein V9G16_00690 [Nitrosomonas sp.]
MLILLGQLLQGVGDPGRFSHSVGKACMSLVIPLLAAAAAALDQH